MRDVLEDLSLLSTPRRFWLSKRVALLLAGCAIGSAAISAAIFLDRAANQQSAIERHALALAETNRFAFDREVAAAVARLEGLASSAALQEVSLKRFYDQLLRVTKPVGTWFVLYRQDRQVLNALLPYGTQPLPTFASSIPNVEERPPIINGRQHFRVAPLVWAPIGKKFVTAIGIPVLRPTDVAATYELVTVIPASNLITVLRAAPDIDRASFSLLVSVDGKIVASKRDGPFVIGDVLPPQLRQSMSERANGVSVTKWRGENSVLAYSKSADVPWISVVVAPIGRLRAVEHRTMAALLLSAVVFLVLGAVAVGWIVRRVDRPFEALREFARDAGLSKRETEARYRAFWENAGDGLFVARRAGKQGFVLETSNPTYLKMASCSETDIMGRPPWANTAGSDTAKAAEMFARCADSGVPLRFDSVVIVRDDSRHWETNLAPIKDPETGQTTLLLGCVRDVTMSCRAKQALRWFSGHILAAQDEERRRIARDLHDSTGQALLGATLAISQSLPELSALQRTSRDRLEDACALIAQAQNELRVLSYLLHPPLLDELGLIRALEEYIGGFAKRSGLDVSFSVVPELQDLGFKPNVAIALFRVAQEAMGNARRHARCRRIDVSLRWIDSASEDSSCAKAAALVIEDDGHGVPLEYGNDGIANPKRGAMGVGLIGMRERMNQIGGSLVLKQRAGAGLEVRAIFDVIASD